METLRAVPRPQEVQSAWTKLAPPSWERRLRDISPITDQTDHLRFRWRAEEECWMLYACLPKGLVQPDRAEQFRVHWSSLPLTEQMGRRRMVTEYQFYMWHTHGLEVRPFWVLQGSTVVQGGTPAVFTAWELAVLAAEGLEGEPVPWGLLPNIPFDERVVQAIQARDRLLRVGNDLDRLIQSQGIEGLTAEDHTNARAHRESVLKWHREANAASSEFLMWYRRQDEYKDTLGKIPAPAGLANILDDWKDTYIATGVLPHAGQVNSRRLVVPVGASLILPK